MVHKGRDYERFFWRDMCGEFPQFSPYCPPRWAKWGSYGKASTIRDWLNTHQPTSEECERIDMEQHLVYTWDTSATAPDLLGMVYDIVWDPDARTTAINFDLTWAAGTAHADKLYTAPPAVHPVPPFSISMLWDNHTTSDATMWDWGTGTVQTFLRIQEQGYPYP